MTEGEDAVFNCSVKAEPKAVVQWLKNGDPINCKYECVSIRLPNETLFGGPISKIDDYLLINTIYKNKKCEPYHNMRN